MALASLNLVFIVAVTGGALVGLAATAAILAFIGATMLWVEYRVRRAVAEYRAREAARRRTYP